MPERKFDDLINNLKDTILTLEFFVDWNKIETNVNRVEVNLNILNYLIGKENIENEFKELIKKYPEVVTTFPILLAIRESRIVSVINEEGNNINYLFSNSTFNEDSVELYYTFFKKTGLERLFKEDKIKNLVDYVFGIEVGMDTNARKNRTGTLMESLVKRHIEKLNNERYTFIRQANKKSIKSTFNKDILLDKASRNFDFAIFDKINDKLFLLEVNYYSGGGSKLKATAGEYKELYNVLTSQNIKFIWITDGLGWKTATRPLEETFNHNNGQILNLKMLSEGELEKQILSE